MEIFARMFAVPAPVMAWALLVLAGLLEVVWALSMKASDGFTRWPYVALTLSAAGASFGLLGVALKGLPVGTAYAVWTGIGAVGAAIFGMVFFGEAASFARFFCIALVVAGILGLALL